MSSRVPVQNWETSYTNLPAVSVKETLPTVQHIVSRTLGNREGAEAMAFFDTTSNAAAERRVR